MTEAKYDFHSCPDRRYSGSLKWSKYAGRDVLPMWVADMDFRAPPEVIEALQARAGHGVFGYTLPNAGVEEAVIDYLRERHGLAIRREWLVWMPGLVPALNAASRAFEKPGDGVMTNTPVYPPFLSAPEWQDKELLAVPLKCENDRYTFDFEAMEAAVTERTRLFILCNPHNPVGRAFSREELQAVIEFCKRHELILVSDEIHCDLLLDEKAEHHTLLNVDPWARENSLTLMAPSKTYNIPGLACSFIIVPDARLRLRFQKASRGMITELNCFAYAGCEAAYRHGEPWRRALLEQLRENYATVLDWVEKELPGISMVPMEATYLAWLDVRGLGLDKPAAFFEDHGVGLSDGALFGKAGFLRLNFGCPPDMLQRALERMAKACQTLAS